MKRAYFYQRRALNCKNNYMMFLLKSLAEKEENEYL